MRKMDPHLCALKTKGSRQEIDTSSLHLRGGEFIAGEVEALMDTDTLVRNACHEILEYTKDRKSVLIFASGVEHAKHIQSVLESKGHACGFVCGETLPFDRTQTLERFKNGDLKYLVNVNVLTTGFDAPNIDCVVMLRPTNSPGLYYQMVGRGFRLHPGKQNCLVLDFGGNILRHGPVDVLCADNIAAGTGSGEAPVKACPQCCELIHAGYATCPECGHVFDPPEKQPHEDKAYGGGIISGEVTEQSYTVREVYYSVHRKRNAPDDHPCTMRVDYVLGLNDYQSEWVCPEHSGFARDKFEGWWHARTNEPFPATAQEAVRLANAGALAQTKTITVRHVTGEKFNRITDYTLGDKPPRLDGQDERDGIDLTGPTPDYSIIDDEELPF